ncbi:MAG: diguanylate cyclase [Peptostreptococcaceae bacterium]|nr:diguanylate cyclase [Peptostreptococcaceae bacterium]
MLKFKKKDLRDFLIYLLSLSIMLGLLDFVLRGNPRPKVYLPDLAGECELRVNGEIPPEGKDRASLPLRSDDEVLLIGKLPRELPEKAFINLHLLYTAAEIFVGGEKIYSYGVERQRKRFPLGAGHHSIPLPKNYQGKKLTIRLIASGGYKLSYILQHLSIGEKDMITARTIYEDGFSFLISVFFMVFGSILFFIFIIFFLIEVSGAVALAYLSLFSFCLGLWGLGSVNFMRVFNEATLVSSYIEFFSFYAIFPAWLFVLADLKNKSRFDRFFCLSKRFFLLFYITVVLSQLLHIRNYEFFLPFYHLFCFVFFLVSIRVLTYEFRMQPKHEKVLAVGIVSVCVVLCVQILLYNVAKYFDFAMSRSESSVLYINMLVIVGTFIVSYGIRFFGNIVNRREIDLLKKMAYQDSLTGLGNRQSGMLRFLEYERERQHYRLFLYDLNNLKLVNDLCGHRRGDRMLRLFSSMLKRVFSGEETLIRLGGDEFLVIQPVDPKEANDEWKSKLREVLDRFNRRHPREILIEVACGTASTYEMETFSGEEILKRADERMYTDKKFVKSGEKNQLE